MTREQMLVLMGQPIELITGSHPTDGGFKILSVDCFFGINCCCYRSICVDEMITISGLPLYNSTSPLMGTTCYQLAIAGPLLDFGNVLHRPCPVKIWFG